MVNVVVDGNDIDVVPGSQLPACQGYDFGMYGIENGSSVKVSKAHLENALNNDNIVFSNTGKTIKGTEITVKLDECNNGDFLYAENDITSIEITGGNTCRVTLFFTCSSDTVELTGSNLYINSAVTFVANRKYCAEIVCSTVSDEEFICVVFNEMTKV